MKNEYKIDLLNLAKTLYKDLKHKNDISLSLIQESVSKALGFSNFNHAIKHTKKKTIHDWDEKLYGKYISSTELKEYSYSDRIVVQDEFWISFSKPARLMSGCNKEILSNFDSISNSFVFDDDCCFIFTRDTFYYFVMDSEKDYSFSNLKSTISKLTENKIDFIFISKWDNKIISKGCLDQLDSFKNNYLQYNYEPNHYNHIFLNDHNFVYLFEELIKISFSIYSIRGNKKSKNNLYSESEFLLYLTYFLSSFSGQKTFNLENKMSAGYISPSQFQNIFDLNFVTNRLKKLKIINDKVIINSDDISLHAERLKNTYEVNKITSNDLFIFMPMLIDKLKFKRDNINCYLFCSND